MSEPLGLESGVVRVVPYDDRWPQLFAAEAARIRSTCALPLALEHVGSTSVPGLAAKPVLDILAGHPADVSPFDYVPALAAAGYEHRGDAGIADHQFFRRGQPRAYHIHLVVTGSPLWRDYLGFRDLLRSDPDVARRYARLKLDLAAQFPRDRAAYIEGKSAFVRALIRAR